MVETMTRRVYRALLSLPRLNHETILEQLPANGLYAFFERGETCDRDGRNVDRIVRVGTHRVNGNFPKRIGQHYGNAKSLGGNKNGSVFRKHLGGAILRRSDPKDLRIPDWLRQKGPSYLDVEEEVSRTLRDHFTFVCFAADEREERLVLERGLIALLAQHPLGEPSLGWLGRYAVAEAIPASGSWNVQHVGALPLTEDEFKLMLSLIQHGLNGGRS